MKLYDQALYTNFFNNNINFLYRKHFSQLIITYLCYHKLDLYHELVSGWEIKTLVDLSYANYDYKVYYNNKLNKIKGSK